MKTNVTTTTTENRQRDDLALAARTLIQKVVRNPEDSIEDSRVKKTCVLVTLVLVDTVHADTTRHADLFSD